MVHCYSMCSVQCSLLDITLLSLIWVSECLSCEYWAEHWRLWPIVCWDIWRSVTHPPVISLFHDNLLQLWSSRSVWAGAACFTTRWCWWWWCMDVVTCKQSLHPSSLILTLMVTTTDIISHDQLRSLLALEHQHSHAGHRDKDFSWSLWWDEVLAEIYQVYDVWDTTIIFVIRLQHIFRKFKEICNKSLKAHCSISGYSSQHQHQQHFRKEQVVSWWWCFIQNNLNTTLSVLTPTIAVFLSSSLWIHKIWEINSHVLVQDDHKSEGCCSEHISLKIFICLKKNKRLHCCWWWQYEEADWGCSYHAAVTSILASSPSTSSRCMSWVCWLIWNYIDILIMFTIL